MRGRGWFSVLERAAVDGGHQRGLVEELKPLAVNPGEYLTGINRGLISVLRQTKMPMFASAFYLIADAGRGELRFANAGHPNPYHIQRSQGTVDLVRGDEGSQG